MSMSKSFLVTIVKLLISTLFYLFRHYMTFLFYEKAIFIYENNFSNFHIIFSKNWELLESNIKKQSISILRLHT